MRVAIVGYGAMGQRLERAILEESDLELVGVIQPRKGHLLKDLSNIPEVIVDFSHPDNLNSILEYALRNHCALLIATTGYNEQQVRFIHEASHNIPIVFTSNTSLGINIVSEVLSMIAPILSDDFDIEIIEKHHNRKIDAPSGTAKQLIESIRTSLKKHSPLTFGREGNALREKHQIGVHAVRGGTIAGEHNVLFAGNDEIIEIKHTALSKDVFVTGALKAIRFLNQKKPQLYSMKHVLQLNTRD